MGRDKEGQILFGGRFMRVQTTAPGRMPGFSRNRHSFYSFRALEMLTAGSNRKSISTLQVCSPAVDDSESNVGA